MYPKGPIWQRIRTTSFDTIPVGSAYTYHRPISLNLWKDAGSYVVRGCTSNSFMLDVYYKEMAGALLIDAEHLLDHAAEQVVLAHAYFNAANSCSDAWTFVTLYYWAFFNSLALSRLQGGGLWFLGTDVVSELISLVPVPSKRNPGAGVYRIELGKYLSNDHREVTLRRANQSRMHDRLWIDFFNQNEDLLSKHGDEQANQLEYRMHYAISLSQKRFGHTWPSDIRNAVNYRPGLAYRAVRDASTQILRSLRGKQLPISVFDAIGHLESELLSVPNGSSVRDYVEASCRALIFLGIITTAMAEENYQEVINRNGFDRRWSAIRRKYYFKHETADKKTFWPLVEA